MSLNPPPCPVPALSLQGDTPPWLMELLTGTRQGLWEGIMEKGRMERGNVAQGVLNMTWGLLWPYTVVSAACPGPAAGLWCLKAEQLE